MTCRWGILGTASIARKVSRCMLMAPNASVVAVVRFLRCSWMRCSLAAPLSVPRVAQASRSKAKAEQWIAD
eukprot:COSAG04_NODE_10500_length_772_cov_1.650817_1_plen_70_part_10